MIGNDYLAGDDGNDNILGGAGNDTMLGGAGNDTLSGNTGNDYLLGDDGNDRLLGLQGNDTLFGGANGDTVYGGEGDDYLGGDAGSDNLFGEQGNDTISGGAGNDALNGGTGNDFMFGDGDNDTLRGFDGDDTVYGDNGRDVLYGGIGNDFLGGDDGADSLFGGDGNDTVDGGAGNDTIIAKTGNDLAEGGSGDDILLSIAGNDTLSGGLGNDTFYVHGASGDLVFVTDAGGLDTFDFSSGSTGALINMNGGETSYVDGRSIQLSGDGVSLQPVDLVLMQDLSGSFSDDVATVEGLVPSLVSGVQAIQPDAFFGVSSFVDKPMSPFGSAASGDYVFQNELALTNDTTAFQNAVNNLVVRYGGDEPEAQIEALMQLGLNSTDVGFRVGSFKAVLLTTDASYHEAGDGVPFGLIANDGDNLVESFEDYPAVSQLRDVLINEGIIPIFAVTSGQTAIYQDLVNQLGFGTVVALSTNSSDIVNAVTSGLATITDTTIESAIGTIYADTINGNEAANTIFGSAGDDIIQGFGGNDTLRGGSGGDEFRYTETFGFGDDRIEDFSLAGNDQVVLATGTAYSTVDFFGDVFVYVGDGSIVLVGAGAFDTDMISFI